MKENEAKFVREIQPSTSTQTVLTYSRSLWYFKMNNQGFVNNKCQLDPKLRTKRLVYFNPR